MKKIFPTVEELLALAELASLEVISQMQATGWCDIPSILVRLPETRHTARIELNDNGEIWATEEIPGLPCQVYRSWPNKLVRIFMGRFDQIHKSDPAQLRALADLFNLEVVFQTSGPKEFPEEHYMLVKIPKTERGITKAMVFHGVDGKFYCNQIIPGVSMFQLHKQHKTKKYRLNV